MCISDISLHLHRKEAFTFFHYFQKKTSGKLVKPAAFWGNKGPEFGKQGCQWRRKSQRVRYLSSNMNCVKLLKTYIISTVYCTNAFLFFLSFSIAHHETSVSQLLTFCHAVFLLWLSMFRIKDLAYMVDPARSKVKNCYVSGILLNLREYLAKFPGDQSFIPEMSLYFDPS